MGRLSRQDAAEMLDVSVTADANTLRKAWWKKAREYHPDMNSSKDAGKIFNKMHEAYIILMSLKTLSSEMRDMVDEVIDHEFEIWKKSSQSKEAENSEEDDFDEKLRAFERASPRRKR